MAYRLEISRNNKSKREEVEEEMMTNSASNMNDVDDLLYGIEVLSNQLNDMEALCNEIKLRDQIIQELEDEIKNQSSISESLINETQQHINTLADNEKEIEYLNQIINDQEEKITKRDNKIERIEKEAQERYQEKCALQDEIERLRKENEKLKRKLKGINNILDD